MLSRRLLRIKAVKALYSHFKSESDSLIVSEKNLMLSIDKTYELYHQMLWLVVEVANYAENRIELGRRKHLPTPEELNPNTKFVDNRVVAALRESDALTDYLQRKKLGWVQAPELVKKLYHAMVESDYYRKYMDAPARSFKEDVRLVESFYTRTVGESEALEEALEEQSILWADDADFAVIMVLRTLDDMREYAKRFYPDGKDLPDTDEGSSLYRFVAYHLLPVMLASNQIVNTRDYVVTHTWMDADWLRENYRDGSFWLEQ